MSDLRGAVADLRYAYSSGTGEGADGPGPLSDLLDDVLRLIPEGAVLVTEDSLAAHAPYVCNGTFLCCECGWDEGSGYPWIDHILDIIRERPTLARLRETP